MPNPYRTEQELIVGDKNKATLIQVR